MNSILEAAKLQLYYELLLSNHLFFNFRIEHKKSLSVLIGFFKNLKYMY